MRSFVPVAVPRSRIGQVATGLFVAMTVIYVLARANESAHPVLPFVRAFAEAAMIGALADWFAVVALFRHPLGLPIPHTAVIPKNKDRIGEGLARFVQENFLAPGVVAEKLAATDVAGRLANWIATGDNARIFSERTMRVLPTLIDAFDDDDIRHLAQGVVVARLRKVEFAPLAGEVLTLLTANDRHHELVDRIARRVAALLEDYEPQIREKVAENTAWLWKLVGVDARISDKLLAVARKTIGELAEDPDHAMRLRVEQMLQELIHNLKTSPRFLEEGEALKETLLRQPALAHYLEGIWRDLRRDIQTDIGRDDSRIREHLSAFLQGLAAGVLEDETVRRKLNRVIRTVTLQIVTAQREEIASMISGTMRRWDSTTFSARIEAEVGRDLQYIRINGTVIGGLAGLAIHSVSLLF
jgi:uncharacterized membrane-anchored protein YjiN (DUF445 family)